MQRVDGMTVPPSNTLVDQGESGQLAALTRHFDPSPSTHLGRGPRQRTEFGRMTTSNRPETAPRAVPIGVSMHDPSGVWRVQSAKPWERGIEDARALGAGPGVVVVGRLRGDAKQRVVGRAA